MGHPAAVTSVAVAAAERPRAPRAYAGAWLLSFATAASGALAYAFTILAARTLSPTDYGLIGVLWAATFLLVVVLFRPLEQTTSRAVADRLARGGTSVRGIFRSVLVIYAVAVAGLAALAAASWNAITDRLFEGNAALTLALVVGVAGYGVAYVLRGLVSGCGWFDGYGLILLGDAGIRLLAALPLVAVASVDTAAAAVALAGIGGAAIVIAAGAGRLRPLLAHDDGGHFRLGGAFAFAAPAAVIAAADQVLVNGGPVLVMLGGGSAKTAGLVFAATMLVRIPVYLFQGLAASLLPNLTRLNAADELARFRRGVLRTSLVLFGLGAVAVAGAAVLGPDVLSGVYGGDFAAGRLELALLASGVAFYLVAATVSQALLAVHSVTAAAVAWAASAVVFLIAYAVSSGDDLMRISQSFALATAIAAASLGLLLARRLARP
jgi:O-antigen/teichoic acid export membrane protein